MQLDLTAILTAIYTGYPCPPPIPVQLSTGLHFYKTKIVIQMKGGRPMARINKDYEKNLCKFYRNRKKMLCVNGKIFKGW